MSKPARDELVAELLRAFWPIPDSPFCLLTVRDRDGVTHEMKGESAENRLYQNHVYRFFGPGWSTYRGKAQFVFTDFVEHTPHSRRTVVAYLSRLPDIGNAIAGALYDICGGEQCIGRLRQDPAGCHAAVREKNKRTTFTEAKAKAAADILKQKAKLEDARLDLIDLFDGRGFPGTAIDACLKALGPAAGTILRKDPFKLLTKRIPGAGFLRVDRLYQELGLPLNRKKRVVYLLWNAITRNGRGDTWVRAEAMKQTVSDSLTEFNFPRAVAIGRRAGVLAESDDEGVVRTQQDTKTTRQWLSRRDWADQETRVVENVLRLVGKESNA